jgi:hypothetical protein
VLRLKITCFLFIFIFPFSSQGSTAIEKFVPPFDVWKNISRLTNNDASLIYSIALVESGKYIDSDKFIPWPFAIGVGVDEKVNQLKHESFYPETFEEAKTLLTDLLARGYTNIGVGIMQVNIRENSDLFSDPVHLLDPVTNLKIASKVIKQCGRFTKLKMLSCYSSGHYESERGQQYASKVFDYQSRFGFSFVQSYFPIGLLTIEQLNNYTQKKRQQNINNAMVRKVSFVE